MAEFWHPTGSDGAVESVAAKAELGCRSALPGHPQPRSPTALAVGLALHGIRSGVSVTGVRAIYRPLSAAGWRSGAKRVRMPMNNAEVVAFSSKDLGCPQLLDEPLLTAPQSCFRSFDVD